MGTRDLRAALDSGIPLVDIVVTFLEGVDYHAATEALNELAEDFHLEVVPHNGRENARIGSGTQAAVERLFGCRVTRVATEYYDPTAEVNLPDFEQCTWDVGTPAWFPLDGTIESASFPQPGDCDNGQWTDPARVVKDRSSRWELWRQDDGGNTYRIATYSTEWTALAAMRAFENRGHKQVYWVKAVPRDLD